MSFRERVVRRLHDWLVCSDPPQPADLIFVLAGRRDRKAHGVKLLRQGQARQLLISTLSADSLDLARFAELNLPEWPLLLDLQARIPSDGRLFFLHFDGTSWNVRNIPVRPLGTLTEIAGLARWLRQYPAIRTTLIVSSASHLRRIRMCCRAFLPTDVRYFLTAVPPNHSGQSTLQPGARQDNEDRLLAEYAKLLVYRMVLAIGPLRARLRDNE